MESEQPRWFRRIALLALLPFTLFASMMLAALSGPVMHWTHKRVEPGEIVLPVGLQYFATNTLIDLEFFRRPILFVAQLLDVDWEFYLIARRAALNNGTLETVEYGSIHVEVIGDHWSAYFLEERYPGKPVGELDYPSPEEWEKMVERKRDELSTTRD